MDMDMEYGSTWSVETLHNIHMDTNMDMDRECIISHMETLHNIHMDTNMDMDTDCIINHMETLYNIYMDTNMDMECIISHMGDTTWSVIHIKCQSTWSMETLQ